MDYGDIIDAFEARDAVLAETLVRKHTFNLRVHVEIC